MSGVFLSYRRDDTSGYAGRLYDRLAATFGAGSIFRDIDALSPGVDFVEAIEGAVSSCQAVVVLIGREWLRVTTPDGRRRLDDPDDFVRLEIAAALERNIRIIPVLVEQAMMPAASELPAPIARLSRFNALEISDTRWDYDVARLIRALDDTPAPLPTPDPAPTGPVPGPPPPVPPPVETRRSGLPLWVRISVPAVLAVILAVVVVLVAGGDDDDTDVVAVTTTAADRVTTTAVIRATTTAVIVRTVTLTNVFNLDEAAALQRLRADGVAPEAIKACSNSVAVGKARQVVLPDRAETELVGSAGVTAAGRAVASGARVIVKISTGACAATSTTR